MLILKAEANFQYWDNERIVAETYIRDLDFRISALPNIPANRPAIQDARNEQQGTRAYLNVVNGELQIARKNLVAPAQKVAAWSEFMKFRTDFLEANRQLRPLVDQAVNEYRNLKKDSTVKDALQTISKRTNTVVSLGPSKNLTTTISKLRQAEEMVSFDPEAYRRKPKRKSKVSNKAVGARSA